jgi:hypothetical protein
MRVGVRGELPHAFVDSRRGRLRKAEVEEGMLDEQRLVWTSAFIHSDPSDLDPFHPLTPFTLENQLEFSLCHFSLTVLKRFIT